MATPLNVYNLDKYNPDDFFIPLTFSLNDFRNLNTRNGVFSKTIKIPGTKKNDSLLGHSFDITAEGFFDRNKRSRAIIERDGIRYLDGSMQLKKVNKLDNNHEYEVVLYGELSDWASLIKDRNIRDLNYSTITFDAATFESTWTNRGDEDEYVVPLIDYSGFFSDTSATDQTVERFRPAVFVYYILDEIFKGIDYQLQKGAFARQELRDLILPYVDEATYASQEELDNNAIVDLDKSTSKFITADFQVVLDDWDTPTTEQDPGSNFNETTGTYTTPFDSTCNVVIEKLFVQNLRTLNELNLEVKLKNSVQGEVNVQNFVIPASSLSIIEVNFGSHSPLSGEDLTIEVRAQEALADYRVEAQGLNITLTEAPIQDGVLFDLVRSVPDIKQSDFVKAIAQMFNLVVLTNTAQRTVEFIHRDDFFKDITEAEDWTEKLDTNKRQEIEQVEDGLSRNFVFEYKDDSNDDNLVNFKEFYSNTYGNKTVQLDNEFLQGDQKISSLPFAPTLMDWTVSGTIYAPKMFNTGFTKTLEPRILIYGGLQNGSFTFDGVLKTQYPFAYSIKNISTPFDISLNFGNLKDINIGLQTNDVGLVDRYYKDQIRQINEGRLYTCYLNLNAIDIVNLDFRTPKLINGVYYHLNKVEDFLAGREESTKVELIQIV